VYYFMYCLFLVVICLDVSLFMKIEDYEKKRLSSSEWEARQVFLDHIDPICFPPLVTLLHASLKLNTYLYLYDWDLCLGSYA
jgi:hypothetical protein